MVMIVLLNVAWMCATPCGTTRFSRFFLNSFLRFDVFAGACVAASCCCGSFAKSVSSLSRRLPSRLYPQLQSQRRSRRFPQLDDSLESKTRQTDDYFRAATFFFAATAPFRGPLRVRALVCVRWPCTGRFR